MTYDRLPFTRDREVIVDAGYLAASRHVIHALIEVDVTRPRQLLKGTSGSDGRPHSFTAFIVGSVAQAVQAHPVVHAYRNLRRQLVVFHEIDVVTLIEPTPGAVAIPHIIRGANRRTVRDISEEVRSIQASPGSSAQRSGLVSLASRVPRFARLLFIRALKLNPHWMKTVEGTVIVTSVGMFGNRLGWGIGFLMAHTLGVTVGGIGERPVVHDGAIAIRECLDMTLSFDHDIVDGAPAARFAQTITEMIESGSALG